MPTGVNPPISNKQAEQYNELLMYFNDRAAQLLPKVNGQPNYSLLDTNQGWEGTRYSGGKDFSDKIFNEFIAKKGYNGPEDLKLEHLPAIQKFYSDIHTQAVSDPGYKDWWDKRLQIQGLDPNTWTPTSTATNKENSEGWIGNVTRQSYLPMETGPYSSATGKVLKLPTGGSQDYQAAPGGGFYYDPKSASSTNTTTVDSGPTNQESIDKVGVKTNIPISSNIQVYEGSPEAESLKWANGKQVGNKILKQDSKGNWVEIIPKMKNGGRINFKSSEAYHKWLAYGHMHKEFEKTPGNQKVSIGGEKHKVKHAKDGADIYKDGGIINKDGKLLITPENSEKSKQLLKDNKDLDFVKRILSPESVAPIDNGDGTTSTHKMAWASNDDGHLIYPTIVNTKDNKLIQLSDDDAYNHAMKTGEFIKTPDPNLADYFSIGGYKEAAGWDKKTFENGGRLTAEQKERNHKLLKETGRKMEKKSGAEEMKRNTMENGGEIEKVTGKTHEQGGEDRIINGKKVEVERGEVIDTTGEEGRVYSDNEENEDIKIPSTVDFPKEMHGMVPAKAYKFVQAKIEKFKGDKRDHVKNIIAYNEKLKDKIFDHQQANNGDANTSTAEDGTEVVDPEGTTTTPTDGYRYFLGPNGEKDRFKADESAKINLWKTQNPKHKEVKIVGTEIVDLDSPLGKLEQKKNQSARKGEDVQSIYDNVNSKTDTFGGTESIPAIKLTEQELHNREIEKKKQDDQIQVYINEINKFGPGQYGPSYNSVLLDPQIARLYPNVIDDIKVAATKMRADDNETIGKSIISDIEKDKQSILDKYLVQNSHEGYMYDPAGNLSKTQEFRDYVDEKLNESTYKSGDKTYDFSMLPQGQKEEIRNYVIANYQTVQTLKTAQNNISVLTDPTIKDPEIDKQRQALFNKTGIDVTSLHNEEWYKASIDNFKKKSDEINQEYANLVSKIPTTITNDIAPVALQYIKTDQEFVNGFAEKMDKLKSDLQIQLDNGQIDEQAANDILNKSFQEGEVQRTEMFNQFNRQYNKVAQQKIDAATETLKLKYESEIKTALKDAGLEGEDVVQKAELYNKLVLWEFNNLNTDAQVRLQNENIRRVELKGDWEQVKTNLNRGTLQMFESLGGGLKWCGWFEGGNILTDAMDQFNAENPQKQVSWDGPMSLMNKDWWIEKGVTTIPSTMMFILPGIGVAGAAGNTAAKIGLEGVAKSVFQGFSGALATRPLESFMEAGGQFNTDLENGMGVIEASDRASKVYTNNMNLIFTDGMQLALSFTKFGKLSGWKAGLIKAPAEMITEGAEEVYQEFTIEKLDNPYATFLNYAMSPAGQETFTLGAMMGVPFMLPDLLSKSTGKQNQQQLGMLMDMMGDPNNLDIRYKQILDQGNVMVARGMMTPVEFKELQGKAEFVLAKGRDIPIDLKSEIRKAVLYKLADIADANSVISQSQDPTIQSTYQDKIKELEKEVKGLISGKEPTYFINNAIYTKEEFVQIISNPEVINNILEQNTPVHVFNDPKTEETFLKAASELKANPDIINQISKEYDSKKEAETSIIEDVQPGIESKNIITENQDVTNNDYAITKQDQAVQPESNIPEYKYTFPEPEMELSKDNEMDFTADLQIANDIKGPGYKTIVNEKEGDIAIRIKNHYPNWANFTADLGENPNIKKIINVTVGNFNKLSRYIDKQSVEDFKKENPEVKVIDINVEEGENITSVNEKIQQSIYETENSVSESDKNNSQEDFSLKTETQENTTVSKIDTKTELVQKTYTEKAKKVADKIRNFSPKKKLTILDEAGNEVDINLTSNDFLSQALEVAAQAVELSDKIADGVAAAIKWLNSKDGPKVFKDLTPENKKRIEKQLTEQIKTASGKKFKKKESPEKESIKKTVTTTRAYEGEFRDGVKKELEKLGLTRDIENQQEAKKKAKQFVESVGEEVALEAVRNNDVSDASGAYVWNQLIESVETKLASEKDPEMIIELEKLEAQLIDEFSRKALSSGRFNAALGDIYQTSDLGYNVERKIKEYKDQNNGEIPVEVEAKFRAIDKELKEVKKKLVEAEQRAKDAEAQLAIDNIKESIARSTTDKSKKKYAQKALNAIGKLRKSIRANMYSDAVGFVAIVDIGLSTIETAIKGGMAISKAIDKGVKYIKGRLKEQGVDEWGKEHDFRKDVEEGFRKEGIDVGKSTEGKLKIPNSVIRDFVERGIDNIEDLTKAIQNEIKEIYPDATEREVRDAITGYGKTVNLNSDEISAQIRKMKRFGRIISSLEDVSNKKRPLKSGIQRDKLDAEERALNKELREAMKDLPMDEELQADQLKTVTDATKQRLKNQIEDLQREIDKGEQVKKTARTVKEDDELKALKEQRDELKKQHESIFKDDEFKEKQRLENIKRATQRRIGELERRIKEGDFNKRKPKSLIADNELTKLRAEKLRLQEEYDKEFYKNKLSNRTKTQKVKDTLWDAWGLTRLLSATGEFSFIGIQGLIQTIAHPLHAVEAFKNALKFFASEKKIENWLNTVKSQSFYQEMKQSKLAITETTAEITAREELFYSDWANLVWNMLGSPLKLISSDAHKKWAALSPFKAFERAASGYLDTLRVMRFLDGKEMLENKGISFEDNPEAYKQMADVINTFTGRASLGKLEQITPLLTKIFFSPRNWASAIKTATPYAFYHFGKMRDGADGFKPSVAQKMAIADFSKFVGLTISIVALAAAYLNNDDDDETGVEFDPRSSDFLKIKVGAKRIDPWGGRIQQVVLLSRLISGSVKKESGEIVSLGTPFKAPTRKDLLIEMATNKLAPSASMLEKFLSTHINEDGDRVTKFGQSYEFSDEIKERITPIYWGTVSDLLKDDPTALDGILMFYAFIGGGVSVYDKKEEKKKKKDEN